MPRREYHEEIFYMFTKYLQLTLYRNRAHYCKKKAKEPEIPFSSLSDCEHIDQDEGLSHIKFADSVHAPSASLQLEVAEALSSLKCHEEEIVRHKVYGRYSFKEIAGLLDMKEETVKTTYYRALKKLKPYFEE